MTTNKVVRVLQLESGKYELRHDETTGALGAYRYGEFWQDFSGNKLVYLLMDAALAALPEPLLFEGITIDKKTGKYASTEDGYTADQLRAAIAAERERCIAATQKFKVGFAIEAAIRSGWTPT